MRKKRLLWQLYWPFLLITVIALVAVTLYMEKDLYQSYLNRTTRSMESLGQILQAQMASFRFADDGASVDHHVGDVGRARGEDDVLHRGSAARGAHRVQLHRNEVGA